MFHQESVEGLTLKVSHGAHRRKEAAVNFSIMEGSLHQRILNGKSETARVCCEPY